MAGTRCLSARVALLLPPAALRHGGLGGLDHLGHRDAELLVQDGRGRRGAEAVDAHVLALQRDTNGKQSSAKASCKKTNVGARGQTRSEVILSACGGRAWACAAAEACAMPEGCRPARTLRPMYLAQPNEVPASTDTRAATEGGSTESLYSWLCSSNSSQQGRDTTRTFLPAHTARSQGGVREARARVWSSDVWARREECDTAALGSPSQLVTVNELRPRALLPPLGRRSPDQTRPRPRDASRAPAQPRLRLRLSPSFSSSAAAAVASSSSEPVPMMITSGVPCARDTPQRPDLHVPPRSSAQQHIRQRARWRRTPHPLSNEPRGKARRSRWP